MHKAMKNERVITIYNRQRTYHLVRNGYDYIKRLAFTTKFANQATGLGRLGAEPHVFMYVVA
jgi:hypothetical protein